MSRSFTKICKGGNTTAKSEKKDKRICNRMVRSTNRLLLNGYKNNPDTDYNDTINFSDKRTKYNLWCMDKDGKRIYATEQDVELALEVIFNDLPRERYKCTDFIIKIYNRLYGHKSTEKMRHISKNDIKNTILHYINNK